MLLHPCPCLSSSSNLVILKEKLFDWSWCHCKSHCTVRLEVHVYIAAWTPPLLVPTSQLEPPGPLTDALTLAFFNAISSVSTLMPPGGNP